MIGEWWPNPWMKRFENQSASKSQCVMK